MCPFNTKTCGKKDTKIFSNDGAKESFEAELQPGEVCVYTLKTYCGSPGYKAEGRSLDGIRVFDINYNDFDIGQLEYPLSTSTEVLIPSNNSALTPQEVKNLYYRLNYTNFKLKNGS